MTDVSDECTNNLSLVGVTLISKSTDPQEGSTNIGVIHVVKDITLQCLRKVMPQQVPSVPKNYIYCTKQGWPIDESLEKNIKVKEIITDTGQMFISIRYSAPKVGIRCLSRGMFGFIFTDYTKSLSDVRNDVCSLIRQDENMPIYFLDSNGWPVHPSQESTLSVIDILSASCLTVEYKSSLTSLPHPNLSPCPGDVTKDIRCLSLKQTRHLSFRSSKDLDRIQIRGCEDHVKDTGKQILISYVRAEAAGHALSLKQELARLGYSVYLDVHEIRSGVDWQDSLNYAVSNCEIFVPLVTSRYGETQWTNREVKLADVLGKYIIPVNFLEDWPPRCLAIQFATVQYINWSSQGVRIPSSDSSAILRTVAAKIQDRINKAKDEDIHRDLTRKPSLVKRRTVVKSCAMVEESNDQAITTDREGKPLVVVCVHPAQKSQSEEMRQWLKTQSYECWVTIDMKMQQENQAASQEKLQEFQDKADDAGVVIAMLSTEFIQSKSCLQQLYYCEQRKRLIAVKLHELSLSGWMEILLGTTIIKLYEDKDGWSCLQRELKRNLDLTARISPKQEISEARLTCAVRQLHKKISQHRCIYVTGSVHLSSMYQQTLCSVVGNKLCELSDVTIVTGGFYGVEYLVGKAFHEAACRNMRSNKVWHILPEKDSQDRKSEAAQNTDGSFQIVDYGQTYFCGESIEDRDSLVARAFDICLVILGDDRCDHIVQKFIWNDHLVIPVQTKNTVKTLLPPKVFQVPGGVNDRDWHNLSPDNSVSTNVIGQSIQRIVSTLQSNLLKEDNEEMLYQSLEAREDNSPPRKRQKGLPKSSPVSQKTNLSTSKTVIL